MTGFLESHRKKLLLAAIAAAGLVIFSLYGQRPPRNPEESGGVVENADGSRDYILVYKPVKQDKIRYRWRLRIPASHLVSTHSHDLEEDSGSEDVLMSVDEKGRTLSSTSLGGGPQFVIIGFEWPGMAPQIDRTMERARGQAIPDALVLSVSNLYAPFFDVTRNQIDNGGCLVTGEKEFGLEVAVNNPSALDRIPCGLVASQIQKRFLFRQGSSLLLDISCGKLGCETNTSYRGWDVHYDFRLGNMSRWRELDSAVKSWLDSHTVNIDARN
jgi:hypothetical protein